MTEDRPEIEWEESAVLRKRSVLSERLSARAAMRLPVSRAPVKRRGSRPARRRFPQGTESAEEGAVLDRRESPVLLPFIVYSFVIVAVRQPGGPTLGSTKRSVGP